MISVAAAAVAVADRLFRRGRGQSVSKAPFGRGGPGSSMNRDPRIVGHGRIQ
jgi:hypothetical protein